MKQDLITKEMPYASSLRELERLAEQQDNKLAMRIASAAAEDADGDLQAVQRLGLGLAKEMKDHAEQTVKSDLHDVINDVLQAVRGMLTDNYSTKLFDAATKDPANYESVEDAFAEEISALSDKFCKEVDHCIKHLVDPYPYHYCKSDLQEIAELEAKYATVLDSFGGFING